MILTSFWISLLMLLHPFHVSVMNIDHAPEENSLQITLKIFADDLEEALNDERFHEEGQPYVDVLNPQDQQRLNQSIEAYLQRHLSIEVNGTEVQPYYLGKEMEGMAMWTYLEVKGIDKIEAVRVKNSLLTEIFDDQINIVHINYRNTVKSMKLAGNQLLDEVSFGS